MNLKHVGLCALVVTLFGVSAVRADDPPRASTTTPYGSGMAMTPVADVPPPSAPLGAPAPVPQLSQYILGPQCDCCGPLGGNTLGYEVYLRNGVSLPFGPGPLAKDLSAGWAIELGARVLFINSPHTAAWTVDLGIVNINNEADGTHPVTLNKLIVPNPISSPQLQLPPIQLARGIISFDRYNRTFVSATFGREWYLWDPANSCGGFLWRAGVDGGFRYGTSKLDLKDVPPHAKHRTKVIGAPVVSVHTDVEVPCGACIWQAGFRLEWSYTFSEILQDQNNAAVHDIMLMLNLGVRF